MTSSHKIFLMLFFMFSTNLSAQNLVSNGDFEVLAKKMEIQWYQTQFGFNDKMKGWWTPTRGSTDILSANTFWPTSIAAPQKGNYAVGMIVSINQNPNNKKWSIYSEMAQCKLKDTLIPGLNYKICFDVSGTPLSLNISKNIGIFLSTYKWIDTTSCNIILDKSPQIILQKPLRQNWQTVSKIFVPDSSYSYLTIGFFPNGKKYDNIYFAIDNVTIEQTNDKTPTFEEGLEDEVVLKNVHFDTNRANLKPSSDKVLLQLIQWLKENPENIIEIQGHTDNIGSESYNLELSSQRANTVKLFLLKRGIPAYQLSSKGYGATIPISDNNTPKGRALNRRVSIRITNVLSIPDLYKALTLAVRNNNQQEAFILIERMKQLDNLPLQLLIDDELKILKEDKEKWKKTVVQPLKNQYKTVSKQLSNPDLAFQLELMFLLDQKLMKGDSLFWADLKPNKKYAKISEKGLKIKEKKQAALLDRIMSKYKKLPTKQEIGLRGIDAIFLIVQHNNDLPYQKKWLKKMETAATYEVAYLIDVAFLTDRIAVLEGRPQLYGTQWEGDELYPIFNKKEVNKRRANVGLPNL